MRFGGQMIADFEDLAHRAWLASRSLGMLRLWWRTVIDLLLTVPQEHWQAWKGDSLMTNSDKPHSTSGLRITMRLMGALILGAVVQMCLFAGIGLCYLLATWAFAGAPRQLMNPVAQLLLVGIAPLLSGWVLGRTRHLSFSRLAAVAGAAVVLGLPGMADGQAPWWAKCGYLLAVCGLAWLGNWVARTLPNRDRQPAMLRAI
jgi:hypothetical protein